jgi:hypothetical protein
VEARRRREPGSFILRPVAGRTSREFNSNKTSCYRPRAVAWSLKPVTRREASADAGKALTIRRGLSALRLCKSLVDVVFGFAGGQ